MRLRDFEGRWRVSRKIVDRRGGLEGRFDGDAVLSRVPRGLAYREEGTLRLGAGPACSARRDYLWSEDPHGIAVRFGDGRFFHRFDPSAAEPEAEHDCAPDRYHVRYDFAAWPQWRAEWRVMGPRKDYRLISRYSPAGQGAGIAASPGETNR